jgi:hypothetical protein
MQIKYTYVDVLRSNQFGETSNFELRNKFCMHAVLLPPYDTDRGAFGNSFQITLCLGPSLRTSSLINYGADKIASGWGWGVCHWAWPAPPPRSSLWAPSSSPKQPRSAGEECGKVRARLQKISLACVFYSFYWVCDRTFLRAIEL